MTRRSRDIGTAAETAVVRYLVPNGFPHAERRSLKGNLDQGDITGTPGICWEVKGGQTAKTASDGLIDTWMTETETERRNSRSDIGILVVQRAGIGPANAGRWWAIWRIDELLALLGDLSCNVGGQHLLGIAPIVRMHLADAVTLLRACGYGTPPGYRLVEDVAVAGGRL